jgi:hypothetical protein
MQLQWPALLQAFNGDHEIASTSVNSLWSAITFVMTLRAARATYWNVQEVEEACRFQLDSLPAYRSAVANVAARLAAVYDAPEAARQVNKCYASFFLPFWWEHVLLRGVWAHRPHTLALPSTLTRLVSHRDTTATISLYPTAPAPRT